VSHDFPSAQQDAYLIGKHILITRPTESATEERDVLSQQLEAWGAKVSWLPLIEIQQISIHEIPGQAHQNYDWIFFTSKNAVRAFLSNPDFQTLAQSTSIAVVGPATAECVQYMGYTVSFISPVAHAEGAAVAFAKKYKDSNLQVLWPCGNLANPSLKDILKTAGMQVYPLVVYQTQPKAELQSEDYKSLETQLDMLVFTSASAIEAWRNLCASLPNNLLTSIPVACLGPKTSQSALKHLGHVEVQAEPHTLPALAQAILNYFRKETVHERLEPGY